MVYDPANKAPEHANLSTHTPLDVSPDTRIVAVLGITNQEAGPR